MGSAAELVQTVLWGRAGDMEDAEEWIDLVQCEGFSQSTGERDLGLTYSHGPDYLVWCLPILFRAGRHDSGRSCDTGDWELLS